MPRFVVFESRSDSVYGDTVGLHDAHGVKSPIDALCRLDRQARRATRGFAPVRPGSNSAVYDVYEIARSAPPAAVTDDHARGFVREHGSLVTSLVAYNS